MSFVLKYILPTLIFALLFVTFVVPKIDAQSCITSGVTVVDGLVSAQSLNQDLKTSLGKCVIDSNSFVPLGDGSINNADSYGDLWKLFYNDSKATKTQFDGNKNMSTITPLTNLTSYYIKNGNLIINSALSLGASPNVTALFFIDGNLSIDNNITHTDPAGGLVFVVKGNINIKSTVTQVDAVLISEGVDAGPGSYSICTAYDISDCPASKLVTNTNRLIINGSLVSLHADKPIKFNRILELNNLPAEQINYQPKYLAILRDIMSSNLLVPVE